MMNDDFSDVRKELERYYQQQAEEDRTRELDISFKMDRLERNMVERDELIKVQGATIEQLQVELTKLEQQNQLNMAEKFGRSSEKAKVVDPESLSAQSTMEEATALPHQRGTKAKGKKAQVLSLLEKAEPIEYLLEGDDVLCPECGAVMEDIGKDELAAQLTYVRGHFKNKQRYRHNYQCSVCRKTAVLTRIYHAPVPQQPTSGGLYDPSAMAHFSDQKYTMGVPMDRLVKSMARDGVYVERDSIYRAINLSAEEYFEPLVKSWHVELQSEPVAMIDDTYFQCNKEPGRKPHTKSTMTMMRTARCAVHQIVVMFYFMNASLENALKVLGIFQGYLHSDGADKFHELLGITNVGCWQHVRHGFVNALKALTNAQRRSLPIAHGLRLVQKMFTLEKEYRKQGMSSDERYRTRLEKTKPIAAEFFEWCEKTLTDVRLVASNEKLEDALHYALNQREYLENVFLDGRLELSNNDSECMFIHFGQGRASWKFADTQAGAKANAIMYSVVLTALANFVHPGRYLEFLYAKLPNTKASDLDTLSPWSPTLPKELKLRTFEQALLDKAAALQDTTLA